MNRINKLISINVLYKIKKILHRVTINDSNTVHDVEDNSTIELTGSNIISRKESYTFKDGVFTVDISGTKQDYYKKDSEAFKEAVKNTATSKILKLFVIPYTIKTL